MHIHRALLAWQYVDSARSDSALPGTLSCMPWRLHGHGRAYVYVCVCACVFVRVPVTFISHLHDTEHQRCQPTRPHPLADSMHVLGVLTQGVKTARGEAMGLQTQPEAPNLTTLVCMHACTTSEAVSSVNA